MDLQRYFKVSISSDKMRASISIIKSLPEDEEVSLEDMKQYSEKNGIIYGFREDVLENLKQSEKAILAEGTFPEHGENGYMEIMIVQEEKEVPSSNDAKIRIDHRDVLTIASAKEGDLLAKKIRPTLGVAGKNIYGKEVRARPGKDIKLRKGKNTELKDNDNALYSLTNGQISILKNTVNVLPTYEVNEDVSLKTGNINFVGNVVIRGNVPPGFEVTAGGDIRIQGTVEGALLKAGGSIAIMNGIVGQDKSIVTAAKDIQAMFINQGNVYAGGNLIVHQTIFHSTCTANGKVICKEGKGLIIGGAISARQGIEANEIGNSMQTRTSLFIGMNEEDLKSKKEIEIALEKEKEEFLKLAKLLKVYVQKRKTETLTAKEKAMTLKIQHSFQESKTKIDELTIELEEIEDFDDTLNSGIFVEEAIYANVAVHFGKYRRNITSIYRGAQITLVNGEITVTTV